MLEKYFIKGTVLFTFTRSMLVFTIINKAMYFK